MGALVLVGRVLYRVRFDGRVDAATRATLGTSPWTSFRIAV